MDEMKQKAIDLYATANGGLKIEPKIPVETRDDLSLAYTPGVGAVSKAIADDPNRVRELTGMGNRVAIISDGSAVLGLGDIGPQASLPVMQGKSLLFKRFADIDCYPIVLDVHTADEIVSAVKAIAPSFGAINLEDIAAPLCFEVERRLVEELEIPVMHDDQHGTAVVVLAGLINANKLTNRTLEDSKIVIVGAGAAGTAVAKLLKLAGAKRILMIDSKGIISASRSDLNPEKRTLLEFTNEGNETGGLSEALQGADVFIGVSKPDLLDHAMIQTMATDPIIFAMANPDPEILPDAAHAAGAAVVATGRSDFPNQINNALAFPGIFRGALDNHVRKITNEHKLAAAKVIAELVEKPTPEMIIPDIFDERLTPAVAAVIV